MFQSSTFQSSVGIAAQKCLAVPHVANEVPTRKKDLLAFMIPVVNLVSNEGEKRSLEKVGMENGNY